MQIILSIVISCQNTTRYLHSKRLIADKEIESMANDNTNLHSAKGVKDDEFYITFETIAEELRHYPKQFMSIGFTRFRRWSSDQKNASRQMGYY